MCITIQLLKYYLNQLPNAVQLQYQILYSRTEMQYSATVQLRILTVLETIKIGWEDLRITKTFSLYLGVFRFNLIWLISLNEVNKIRNWSAYCAGVFRSLQLIAILSKTFLPVILKVWVNVLAEEPHREVKIKNRLPNKYMMFE